MTCRKTDLSSAVTSYGRIAARLSDRMDSGIYHKLTDEGEGTPDPHNWQLQDLIDEFAEKVKVDPDLSHKRKLSIIKRLESHSEAIEDGTAERVSGPEYYAMQRFVDRARQARTALDEYLDGAARDLGITRGEVRDLLDDHITHAMQQGRTCEADPEWAASFEENRGRGLPVDRCSKYAYQQIEKARSDVRGQQETKYAVTLESVDSEVFNSIGYNSALHYMEVEFRSRPGRVYSYRIPPQVYKEFRAAPDLEGYYQSRIRGNPEFIFTSADEWEAARTMTRCPSCGQFFNGTSCTCPVKGSVEEFNRTVRLARAAVLGTTAEAPTAAVKLPEPTKWRHYDNEIGSVSTFPLTEIQAAAKKSGVITAPVRGKAVDDDGNAYLQDGLLYTEYLGYGQGFNVSAVVNPGESEQDHLKCSCPEYAANYTCKHVRALVADVANRLNAESIRKPETVPADRRTSPDDLIPSTMHVGVAWQEPESLWLSDTSRFRDAYDNAVAAMRAGIAPVPFRPANATGGMGIEGVGRPVGIEIEFDFPPSMSEEDREKALAAIGRAAYRSGLTGAVRQEEYGEQKDRGYSDTHVKGWVFKKDATCAGEFTSPIMWDTKESWDAVKKVTDTIKRYGGIVTPKTGLHVHVSVGDYRNSNTASAKLLNMVTENEDLLFRLATNPDQPQHRGAEHCARNAAPGLGYASVSDARLLQGDNRDVAVNFQNVNDTPDDHIEYRLFNGSLDPGYIQGIVVLSLGMTQNAMREGTDSVRAGSLGEHAARAARAQRINWEEDSREFRQFIDTIVWNDECKEQLTAIFASTHWQSADVAVKQVDDVAA